MDEEKFDFINWPTDSFVLTRIAREKKPLQFPERNPDFQLVTGTATFEVDLGNGWEPENELRNGWIDVRGLARGADAEPRPYLSLTHEVTFSASQEQVASLFRQLKLYQLRYRLDLFRKLYGRSVGAITKPQICGRVLRAKLIHNLNYTIKSLAEYYEAKQIAVLLSDKLNGSAENARFRSIVNQIKIYELRFPR